jgi:hypothetical protein
MVPTRTIDEPSVPHREREFKRSERKDHNSMNINMKRVMGALIALAPIVAWSQVFEDRVRIAKAAEDTEPYKSYPFVLVAEITREGKATAVEVRPSTNISRCFAEGVRTGVFPKPPEYPGREGFPIVLNMTITRDEHAPQ